MNETVGQVVTFGVAAGLSPIPIVGVVLMLGTTKPRTNSAAFLGAWIASIVVVGLAAIFVVGASSLDDAESSGRDGLRIVVGTVLVLLAAKQWRARPRSGQHGKTPSWMNAIDTFTAARSAALGFALAVINPKNLLLVLAASTSIAAGELGAQQEVGALLLFTAIASIGVGVPVAIYFALGERSDDVLAGLRVWMIDKNAVIMTVICAILGVALIAQGTSGS